MMKILILAGAFLSHLGFASAALDQQYAVKKIVGAVINLGTEPVHGDAVEKGLLESINSNHRFELSKEGQALLKARLTANAELSFGSVEEPNPALVLPSLAVTAPAQIHAAVLAEIKKAEGKYGLLVVLVNARTQEVIAHHFLEIPEPMRLESFSTTAKRALAELDKRIPFQATVLSRDGYRVVLDRGMPHFRQGMQVRVFTLESWQGKPVFEETGLLTITRAEKNISFARIVADKRPKEIQPFNKILSTEKLKSEEVAIVGPVSRGPASLMSGSVMEASSASRGTLGYVDAKVGFSMASFNQSLSNGSNNSSGNTIYPTATVLGHVLITSRVFFDLGFQFASANVTNPNVSDSTATLGSSLTSWRGQLGYRLLGGHEEASLDVKLGYGSQKYTIGAAPDPFLFATSTYSGLLTSGAIHVPVTNNFGMGLDVTMWLFPALSETPVTGGASSSPSGFDFGLRGYYRFSRQLNLEARLAVLSHSAEFEGSGTRATPLLSSSQSTKQFLAGLSYFF